jgi:DNA-directed RNA polymerase specialized sigma24 family protein
LVEHFFRHEAGRLHGALIRLLGVHNLALAEDVAQEALLRALRNWSMGGVPANPSAWITQVAMNLARDALRHQRMATGKGRRLSRSTRPAISTFRPGTSRDSRRRAAADVRLLSSVDRNRRAGRCAQSAMRFQHGRNCARFPQQRRRSKSSSRASGSEFKRPESFRDSRR